MTNAEYNFMKNTINGLWNRYRTGTMPEDSFRANVQIVDPTGEARARLKIELTQPSNAPPKVIDFNAGRPTCAYCGYADSKERPLSTFIEVRLREADQQGIDLHQSCLLIYMMAHSQSMLQCVLPTKVIKS